MKLRNLFSPLPIAIFIALIECVHAFAQPPAIGSPKDVDSLEKVHQRIVVEHLLDEQINNMVRKSGMGSIVKRLLENDLLLGSVELVESQRNEIREAFDVYTTEKHDVEEQLRIAEKDKDQTAIENAKEKLFEIERDFGNQLGRVLMPEQVESIAKHDFSSVGPIPFLIAPGVAKDLELTSGQINEIQRRRERLAERIVEFSDSVRRETQNIVLDGLSPTQQKKLLDLIPNGTLERYIENATIEAIYAGAAYEYEKSLIENRGRRLPRTEIPGTKRKQ